MASDVKLEEIQLETTDQAGNVRETFDSDLILQDQRQQQGQPYNICWTFLGFKV